MGLIDAARQGLKREATGIREHDMPWGRRLWLYRHGFISSRDVMYDLSEETVDDYITDVQRLRTKSINARHRTLLKNKLVFHRFFADSHPDHVPEIYGLLAGDEGVRRLPCLPFESTDDLFDHVANARLVVKPKASALGRDVHVLGHDGDRPTLDGEAMSEASVLAELADLRDAILVEYVQQADYAADIYPESANTVRCLTMVDPATGEPFVATAVHRFGSASSRHVDNFSSGGLVAPVDVETGELEEAAASTKGGSTFARVATHPDTGVDVAGVRIPEWEAVRDRLLEVAAAYADVLPYVGWDVVVTDHEGSFTLIEGNSSPDLDLLQTHAPLLADDRVRRFYDHHDVL